MDPPISGYYGNCVFLSNLVALAFKQRGIKPPGWAPQGFLDEGGAIVRKAPHLPAFRPLEQLRPRRNHSGVIHAEIVRALLRDEGAVEAGWIGERRLYVHKRESWLELLHSAAYPIMGAQ